MEVTNRIMDQKPSIQRVKTTASLAVVMRLIRHKEESQALKTTTSECTILVKVVSFFMNLSLPNSF
ncbi:hypothetical protein KXD40_009321 [Peronospora effusa]|nr:hypothetical protein KXD40_009321 [Peronospora effusa]